MATTDDRHVWTEEDRDRLGSRTWQVPRALVEGGTWARLWRAGGGHGAATSILPVLALHSWPDRRAPADGWSRWASIGRRRMAALAGLTLPTTTRGLAGLVSSGLVQTQNVPMQRGGYRTRYRVSASLYARRGEPYGAFPGWLVGGGVWAVVPTPAARHLYIVITATDAIGDEDKYIERIREDSGGDPWQQHEDADPDMDDDELARWWLDLQRARHPMPLSQLATWAGYNRPAVCRTLGVLEATVHDNRALVRWGTCGDRRAPGVSYWYAPTRWNPVWHYKLDVLNDPEWLSDVRAAWGR